MALSADTQRAMASTPYLVWSFPVYQTTTIYKGGLVSLNSTGYLVMATDSGTDLLCVGIAAEGVDNSAGASAALNCKVISGVLAQFTSGTIALTDQGADLYVSDDDTVDLAAVVSNVRVGMLYKMVTTTSCWVFIPTAGEFATTINTADIANLAVTGAKIANTTITTGKLALLAVDTAQLALDCIDETLIADEAVQIEHFIDQAVDQTAGSAGPPILVEIHANAGGTTYNYACDRDLRAVDFWVIAKATNGGGTAQLQDHAGNAISDAVDCSTDGALARATTFDDANYDEVAGQNLKVVQNGAADNGNAYILCIPKA